MLDIFNYTPYVLLHAICTATLMYIGFSLRNLYPPKLPKNIKDKHVVITGGSSGIGKCIAIQALKKGAIVTIVARNEHRLETAVEEIKLKSKLVEARIDFLSLDCSNGELVEEKLLALDDEEPIHALINCAGLAICGRFEDLSYENIKKLIDINLYGTIFPTKTLLPRMKKRQSGMIVLTASQAALVGLYGYSAYSATKFALRGLAESLHMEMRDYNVSITLALPPDTNTAGFEDENLTKPSETRLITEKAGSLYEPEAVAKKILYDAVQEKFFSFMGTDSYLLCTLCVGMSKCESWLALVAQTMIIGPIRFVVAVFYLQRFQKIVSKCKIERETPVDKDRYCY